MNKKDFSFLNKKGISLSARIYSPEKETHSGVIFSHGLFSSKDGYKITRLAHTIISCGYALMTFDFTFAGESSGNISEISFMEEVYDLQCAIDTFKQMGIKKIHLMGSSMGAAVSLFTAGTMEEKFESLILIATPVDLLGIIPQMDKSKADLLDENAFTTISGIQVKNKFLKELSSIDIAGAAKKIKSPVLLFHGREDKVVSFKNHEILLQNIKSRITSCIIEDGDHNLTRDSDIDIMSQKISQWLRDFYA